MRVEDGRLPKNGSAVPTCVEALEVLASIFDERLPFKSVSHLKGMLDSTQLENFPTAFLRVRKPPEPSPAPIKEPPDAPENPDAPVREPDPDEPAQM
jgi:hypothetical protein